MSFYKLENATISEAQEIITKLDEEEKKVYLLKAADMSYISNEVFAVLVDCFEDHDHVLAEAFSEIILKLKKESNINPKLDTLLATGADFSQVASQSLINGAYSMNINVAQWLIAHGADASYADNSALRNAMSENNNPVIKELLKHGDNIAVYDRLLGEQAVTLEMQNLTSFEIREKVLTHACK